VGERTNKLYEGIVVVALIFLHFMALDVGHSIAMSSLHFIILVVWPHDSIAKSRLHFNVLVLWPYDPMAKSCLNDSYT